jgi:hypothetical protein
MYMECGSYPTCWNFCKPVLAGHTVDGSNHLDLPVYGNNDDKCCPRAWRGQPIWNRKQLICSQFTACSQAMDLYIVRTEQQRRWTWPGVCRSGWSPAMNGRPRRARLLLHTPTDHGPRLVRCARHDGVPADSSSTWMRWTIRKHVLYVRPLRTGLISQVSDMHATVPSVIHRSPIPICSAAGSRVSWWRRHVHVPAREHAQVRTVRVRSIHRSSPCVSARYVPWYCANHRPALEVSSLPGLNHTQLSLTEPSTANLTCLLDLRIMA